jgi:glycerol-3-phosphate dehydrogenase
VPTSSISTQLLIIGGGATGLGAAWDACLRGLKVILVEQNDLGQGTSGRYHGLLHSGGRYVISDPVSARDCASENAILRRIAPQAIEDTGGLFVTTPADPADFADRWRSACADSGVAVEEWSISRALEQEPLLNPRISRAFHVADAALDSFDLLHYLAEAIRQAGGQVLLHHRVDGLEVAGGRVTSASFVDERTGESRTIGAEMLINAAGPWTGKVASMAGIRLPVVLSKGSMIAMTTRLVHTVVNRCRPPQDGDVIVPVGTVAVLGTTDFQVDNPGDRSVQDWEVDRILAEAEVLIPSLSDHRPLRAWAGVRALHRPADADRDDTRELPRAHAVLNHASRDGIEGMLSVIGGKLTTYRLMAEATIDVVCGKLGIEAACSTSKTPIGSQPRRFHRLPNRLAEIESSAGKAQSLICECELATRMGLEASLSQGLAQSLDDSRRDLRLGMGPCQAAFCGYRAAALAADLTSISASDGGYRSFLKERWRGVRPLAWGKALSQLELTRRISIELLAADTLPEDPL